MPLNLERILLFQFVLTGISGNRMYPWKRFNSLNCSSQYYRLGLRSSTISLELNNFSDRYIAEVSDAELINEITGSNDQTDCFNDDGGDDEALLSPIPSQLQAVTICKRHCYAFNNNHTTWHAESSLRKGIWIQRLFTVRKATLDELKKHWKRLFRLSKPILNTLYFSTRVHNNSWFLRRHHFGARVFPRHCSN